VRSANMPRPAAGDFADELVGFSGPRLEGAPAGRGAGLGHRAPASDPGRSSLVRSRSLGSAGAPGEAPAGGISGLWSFSSLTTPE